MQTDFSTFSFSSHLLISKFGACAVAGDCSFISGHLRDLPKCPLNMEGVRLIEVCTNCAMFVNNKLSTVILYCDKVSCC